MVDKLCIVNNLEDDTLLAAESGSVQTNRYATSTVTLTLPTTSGNDGVYYYFVSAATVVFEDIYILRIQPQAGDIIIDNSLPTTGEYIYADDTGECITLVSDGAGQWIMRNKYGIWTAEV